jgi:transglutaminase-like putative cysteine protease
MHESSFAASQRVQFINEDAIEWSNVRRARCQFYQRFHYAYPGPIQRLKQRLMVIPADRYGSQRLSSHTLAVDPQPDITRFHTDRFGNRIFELEMAHAADSISFEVLMSVEQELGNDSRQPVSHDLIQHLLKQTPLTKANRPINQLARQLQRETSNPHQLAQSICDWVYGVMRYESSVTTVDTTAAEVFTLRRGLCQDYSHLMLSLCRAVGLPARYVSGHLLGEGGSHAWVEVLLPLDDGFVPFAFDPTNNRHPDLTYITVAVGRDYRDVSPTSGTFVAPYSGKLTCSKRAGLTFVEYLNGDILQSQTLQ